MSQVTHHVTVRLARDYEFVAEFNDVPGAGSVMFDEPAPLGGGRAPTAADVLGAAIGNCLCASLTYALRKAQVELRGMTAHVTTHIVRGEHGHRRISGIEVELEPALGRSGPAVLAGTGESFEDFCTVTASVRHGIPISVSMKPAPVTIES